MVTVLAYLLFLGVAIFSIAMGVRIYKKHTILLEGSTSAIILIVFGVVLTIFSFVFIPSVS